MLKASPVFSVTAVAYEALDVEFGAYTCYVYKMIS
jgi:hypothetical protein